MSIQLKARLSALFTSLYGNPRVFNTYQVIAVDSAGNQSAPATLTTCAGG